MSVLFRKSDSGEQRSAGNWAALWGSGQIDTVDGGKWKTALSLVPVYASTSHIADAWASSPWCAYEKSAAGVPVKSAVQPRLLTDPGTFALDLYSWRFQLASSLGLWGNAYGLVTATDQVGTPAQVVWLRPDRVEVDEEFGRAPRYFYEGRLIDAASMIHIPWYVVPGSVKGLSPIGVFRTQIETGVEAQKTGKSFYKRGAVPGAILKHSMKGMTSEQATEAKRRFMASTSSNEPFVSGSDWDYQSIPLPPSDVNFIHGVKLTANQIAAVYRVDPDMVGGEAGGSTLKYATLEMNELNFNTRTLRPFATRVESALDRVLPPTQYVKANLDARVRADLKTRYESHKIAIDAGFKTLDEVRALEELPPLTTGDGDASARSVAELVQKLYLGVGVVLTADEARTLANRAGAGFEGSLPVIESGV
jgi:HK97 family phage portal protein